MEKCRSRTTSVLEANSPSRIQLLTFLSGSWPFPIHLFTSPHRVCKKHLIDIFLWNPENQWGFCFLKVWKWVSLYFWKFKSGGVCISESLKVEVGLWLQILRILLLQRRLLAGRAQKGKKLGKKQGSMHPTVQNIQKFDGEIQNTESKLQNIQKESNRHQTMCRPTTQVLLFVETMGSNWMQGRQQKL